MVIESYFVAVLLPLEMVDGIMKKKEYLSIRIPQYYSALVGQKWVFYIITAMIPNTHRSCRELI